MEKELLNEIEKELNFKDKIILRILKKYTLVIYKIAGKNILNNILS